MRAAYRFATSTYKENVGLLISCMLTFFAAWVLLEVLVVVGQDLGFVWWLSAHITFFIIFAGLEVGFMRICLDLYDGKPVAYSDIFSRLRLGPKFFLMQLAYGVTVLVGLILLIIPGAYLGTRYTFYAFLFTEGKTNLQENFQRSKDMAQNTMGSLFWFLLFLLIFNIVGFSILGIGALVTVPVSMLMKTHMYRQLNG